ncbi:uncharacterized protein LOC127839218 isoform X2 [Dreissena polymorpha]|nr:uncharacterized protein LOC127839218 isoform X2 [Dreissena polymorpha]
MLALLDKLKMTDSIESVLEELKSQCHINSTPMEDIMKSHHILKEELKPQKNVYMSLYGKKKYLECLAMDKSEWPQSQQDIDLELKEARQDKNAMKEAVEEEKERYRASMEALAESYEKLQEKIKLVEGNLEVFEAKRAKFESRMALDPPAVKRALGTCDESIATLRSTLAGLQSHRAELEASVAKARVELAAMSKITGKKKTRGPSLKRLQEICAFLETQTGVRVVELSPERLRVEFLRSSQLSANVDQAAEFKLQLTLNFDPESRDEIRLASVKINNELFNIDDLVDQEVACTDVPYLILAVREKWVRCYPLLSEIDLLNRTHAIDWIQEECKLRVLVGRCGKAMVTLSVPRDYPATRGITLQDTPALQLTDLPDSGASLTDWVIYLEKKFAER